MTFRQPYGVCAGIIPWNVTLAMCVLKVAPAIAAGNVIIIKVTRHLYTLNESLPRSHPWFRWLLHVSLRKPDFHLAPSRSLVVLVHLGPPWHPIWMFAKSRLRDLFDPAR